MQHPKTNHSAYEYFMCTSKIPYASAKNARAAQKRRRKKHKRTRPMRVYQCPVCKYYHLTKEKKPS